MPINGMKETGWPVSASVTSWTMSQPRSRSTATSWTFTTDASSFYVCNVGSRRVVACPQRTKWSGRRRAGNTGRHSAQPGGWNRFLIEVVQHRRDRIQLLPQIVATRSLTVLAGSRSSSTITIQRRAGARQRRLARSPARSGSRRRASVADLSRRSRRGQAPRRRHRRACFRAG
jgi:hypothetical protein